MKTKVTEIFLDLDDVLNDCTQCLIKEVERKTNVSIDYELITAYGWWGEFITHKELFGGLVYGDWRGLPISYNGTKIYAACTHLVGRDNVYVCTRPTQYRGCLQGKLDWCIHHLGIHHSRFIPICNKYLLAKPNRVLIDDNRRNCIEWVSEGGQSITYSRPWNDMNWQKPLPPTSEDHWREEMAFRLLITQLIEMTIDFNSTS